MSAMPQRTSDNGDTAAWNAGLPAGHAPRELVRFVDRLDVVTVLEVGCAGGDGLAVLAGGDKRYILSGVDASATVLRCAAQRVPRADFAMLDVERSRLDRQFDLVMSLHLVETIDDDGAALQNMAAMAARHVLVSTITGPVPAPAAGVGPVRSYAPEDLRAKLEAAGLDVRWVRSSRGRFGRVRHAGHGRTVLTALASVR